MSLQNLDVICNIMDRYKISLLYNNSFHGVNDSNSKNYIATYKRYEDAVLEFETLEEMLKSYDYDHTFKELILFDNAKSAIVKSYTKDEYTKACLWNKKLTNYLDNH